MWPDGLKGQCQFCIPARVHSTVPYLIRKREQSLSNMSTKESTRATALSKLSCEDCKIFDRFHRIPDISKYDEEVSKLFFSVLISVSCFKYDSWQSVPHCFAVLVPTCPTCLCQKLNTTCFKDEIHIVSYYWISKMCSAFFFFMYFTNLPYSLLKEAEREHLVALCFSYILIYSCFLFFLFFFTQIFLPFFWCKHLITWGGETELLAGILHGRVFNQTIFYG